MHILHDHPELGLETAFLLDQVQKGRGKELSNQQISSLRKMNLIEGRKNALYLSSSVARSVEQEAQYIRNRGFNDQYYRDMITNYLREYGKGTKIQFRDLLLDKLPDSLNSKQKEQKIGNLLTSLKKKGVISVVGRKGRYPIWELTT